MKTVQRFRKIHHSNPLAQLLSRHDDSSHSGFITRLDRSTARAKKIAFFKGLLLNTVILACLVFLAAITVVHELSPHMPGPLRLGLCITQDTFVLWASVVMIRSTLIPFFWGECRLRIRYGFQITEIVIRKLPGLPSLSCRGMSENQRLENYWRVANHAINPRLLYSNLGAMLSNDYWVLEYAAILDAYKTIERKQIEIDDLEFAIWRQEHGAWTACELWRMHEIMSDHQEVAFFKAFLTMEGKEDLIAIWQNMSSDKEQEPSHGVSSSKSYQAMVDQFALAGVDFESVWSHAAENTKPQVK